jgi:hypothetical protein
MDHSAAAAGLFATFALVYSVVFLGIVAFMIWVYWRIFAKAGYNGALSLLNLIPGIGQLICLIILAFGRWPIEDQLPPPAAGTSVMPSA